MANKVWVAEFYPNIPGDGDVPLHTIEVKAEGLAEASQTAGNKALARDIKSSYMVVRPL